MVSTLLFLAACLMFSGVHGASESMSCSTVNGKTICNKQTSQGNSAMASSQAKFGGGSSFQRTYTGAGNPDTWDSSSQTVVGGPFRGPFPSHSFGGAQAGAGGFARGGPFRGPFPPHSFGGAQTGAGGFARGGPFTGAGFTFPPNHFGGYQAGAGGFASGGAPGPMPPSFAGPMPPMNPFDFVNRFMGGGPGAGAFAGAGFMPFGRR